VTPKCAPTGGEGARFVLPGGRKGLHERNWEGLLHFAKRSSAGAIVSSEMDPESRLRDCADRGVPLSPERQKSQQPTTPARLKASSS
jgi:hypothetical protein